MIKIPSVWVRNHDVKGAPYKDEVTPGCEWVLAGEGIATRKWDGTAVLVRGGVLYARFDAKHGKPPPLGFDPCQDPDPQTGHWPGWVPATRPQDKWIMEASLGLSLFGGSKPFWPDGTYEACGPKIGGNPEGLQHHRLIRHGDVALADAPRTFDALKEYLAPLDIEGIVFHHNGRMAKATKQGFGLRRRP